MFTEQLPENLLDRLASLGHIDRRSNHRDKVTVAARAKWESAEDVVPVQIVSISPGGVGIKGREVGQVGEEVQLAIDRSAGAPCVVLARAVWHRPGDGHDLMGCALESRADYERLRDAIGPNEGESKS